MRNGDCSGWDEIPPRFVTEADGTRPGPGDTLVVRANREIEGGDVMRHHRTLLTAATLAAISLVPLGVTGATAAGFHFADQQTFEDPALDVCGVTVHWTNSVTVRITVAQHGRTGLEYWVVTGRRDDTFTHDGVTLTATSIGTEKDMTVIDHGDGTLTLVELATGNATLYGPDGRAIARDPGQIRYMLEIDADGNPTFGDVVKDSTGRSDDFCGAFVAAYQGAGAPSKASAPPSSGRGSRQALGEGALSSPGEGGGRRQR